MHTCFWHGQFLAYSGRTMSQNGNATVLWITTLKTSRHSPEHKVIVISMSMIISVIGILLEAFRPDTPSIRSEYYRCSNTNTRAAWYKWFCNEPVIVQFCFQINTCMSKSMTLMQPIQSFDNTFTTTYPRNQNKMSNKSCPSCRKWKRSRNTATLNPYLSFVHDTRIFWIGY